MLASSSGRSRVGMKYTKSFTKAFSLSFKYVFPKQLKKKKKKHLLLQNGSPSTNDSIDRENKILQLTLHFLGPQRRETVVRPSNITPPSTLERGSVSLFRMYLHSSVATE